MSFCVCGGALLSCSFGAAPSSLMVTPENKTVTSMPIATIMDHVPMKNIMPFGMCNSLMNPQVAAATAAAFGVLTPMPCIPLISAPWAHGSSTVMISNKPVLNKDSQAFCSYAGIVKISYSGTTTIQVP